MNDSASIRRTGVDLGKGEFQLEEAERIRSLASGGRWTRSAGER
jgi:hypothetical protein